ncbi:hypothetical protein [Bosea vaviloviae]|uniref:YkuD domain-containing protein n=1 Tax=Bosea vaviloviae TaxID=1526658 RepID=A0A1D7U1E9_9HYPH|nr:hypothetical protein [Bosea vaviloviae]AOO81202.1 hypothetical protein BHK69_12655 [Bosea vaviloviae]
MPWPDLTIGGRDQPSWIIKPRADARAHLAVVADQPAATGQPVIKEQRPPPWLAKQPLDFAAFGRQLNTALCGHAPIDAKAWLALVETVPWALQDYVWRAAEIRLGKAAKAALRKRENRALYEQIEAVRLCRPDGGQLYFQTPKQQFDAYAAVFRRFASPMARVYFMGGMVSLLSLRNESSTLAHHGEGSYDDRLVVLRRIGSTGISTIFPICTEPGAQYSQRAASKPGGGRQDRRYGGVHFNKIDGEDGNKDKIKDLGRLIEGTYHYYEKPNGHVGARAFQTKVTQVVERDTDGDGRFTTADPSRIDPRKAGTSMYIHQGGKDSVLEPDTWSAGCQTIPTNRYKTFLATVGKPNSLFYVLVNAAP